MRNLVILVMALVGTGWVSSAPAQAGSKGRVKPPPPLAKLVKKRIVVRKRIEFISWRVRKTSLPTLRAVAGILRNRSKLRVRIEVHTDSQGSSRFNQRHSQLKADQLKQILVKMGLKANRLKAVGRGESRPIASNRSLVGREKNRRVELHVVPRSKWGAARP